jgi:hypothetical protein
MEQLKRLRNVQALWCDSWSDGPVTGIALHEGRQHWFRAIFDERTDDWTAPRQFELVALSDEEIAREREMHKEFEQQVSTHYCFHLEKNQRFVKPYWDKTGFWEKFPPRHDAYRDRPVVGWFEEDDLIGWR